MTSTKAAEASAAVAGRDLTRAVATISRHLLSGAADLEYVLEMAGQAAGASRAYLFRFGAGGTSMSNTHEWCAPGVEPQREHLQDLPVGGFAWWTAKLRRGETIAIEDVDALPSEATAEREALQAQAVQAAIVVPVYLRDDRLYGFVGFDDCTTTRVWSDDDLFMMQVLGDVLAGYLDGAEARRALEASEARFRQLAETISEVFYLTGPEGVEYVSPAYETVWQASQADLLADPRAFLEAIVPEDRARVAESLVRQQAGEATEEIYRIRRPDGTERWIRDRAFPVRGAEQRTVGIAEDITERRIALDRLREEYAFRTAVEASTPAGIVAVDGEGRLIYVNPAFCELVGWPEEALVGTEPPFLYWPEEEQDRNQAALEQMLRGEMPKRGFDLRFKRKNGERFDAQVLFAPLDRGATDGWLASVFDVTEQRQAVRALQANRERLEFILDAAQVGTWDWDLVTDEVKWSPNLETIHGRAPGHFAGTFESVQEDIVPEDKAALRAAIDRALANREDYHVQYRVAAADGRTLWVEAKGRATYDADGRPVRMAGICMDVTARASAEHALRQKRRVLETVNAINTSLAGELDLEKLVQTVTDAGTELSGAQFGAFFYNVLSEDEERGSYMLYTLSGAPRSAFAQYPMPRSTAIFHPTFAGEGVLRLDDVTKDPRYAQNPPYHGMPEGHLPVRSYLAVPVIARDGSTIGGLFFGHEEVGVFTEEAEAIVSGIADQAAIAVENARLFAEAQRELKERMRAEYHLTELNDQLERRVAERTAELEATNARLQDEVAERARAEAALAQTNRTLVQRNRELQEFAYVASHDLQEPLRKISSFADLLQLDYADTLDAGGRVLLDRMQESALRMSTLLRDLLAFSRVSTQGRPAEPHDLEAILQDVLADLELQIRDTGGTVDVGPLPTLEVDATQVRQLFQNLIGNALKFHRPGVPPVVTLRATTAGTAHEAVCRITVKDNGIGFEDKYLDRIFKPFQRLHGREAYPGTGMGLAICRRIVERHDGTISAHSVPGEGATFVIELPVERRERN